MTELNIQGEQLVADVSGALYWPAERTLIVADMHLEKGSAFAARGQFLPPYDTQATLHRLEQCIDQFQPTRIISLGDSFHDGHALERMDQTCIARIKLLANSHDMIWIAGNHDPERLTSLPGQSCQILTLRSLQFCHEPSSSIQLGEVAGHLHPAAKVVTEKGSMRQRTFVTDGKRLIMPAFGAFTGGLNVLDPAIQSLFDPTGMRVYVCGQKQVFVIGMQQLRPDRALKIGRSASSALIRKRQ